MRRLVPLAILLALGCAGPRTTYDWGRHDDRLYALMKDPGKLEAYGLSLREVIDRHPDGKGIPPGVCGEYGYLLLVSGKAGDAERYFVLEKTYWPESARIMDRMIGNCHPKAPESAAPPAVPAPSTPAPATPTPQERP